MFAYAQEAAIDEYFKPIDKEAQMVMKMQLDGEEKSMKQMLQTMQKQALLEKAEAEKLAIMQHAEAEKIAATQNAEVKQQIPEKPSTATPGAEVSWSTQT